MRCAGYRTCQVLFLEKAGARSYFNLLSDCLLCWGGGLADVLKVMALSHGLGRCVPPRAAFQTVTIAVSGAAVSVVLRGKEMEEVQDEEIVRTVNGILTLFNLYS